VASIRDVAANDRASGETMNPRDHATADCRHCHGRGKMKTGAMISDIAICSCVLEALSREQAQASLHRRLAPRAQAMTLDSFRTGDRGQNKQALDVARNFVDNYQRAREFGWVLGFYGHPRAGKTHLAVAITQACSLAHSNQDRRVTTQLLNLPKAFAAERESYSAGGQSPFVGAAQVDLLVVDDLGSEYERQTDRERVSWGSELMYDLVNTRYMESLPLIYTTNLSPADLERRFDNETWKRVYSRLTSAQVIEPIEIVRVGDKPGADEGARAALHAPRDD
jgi:DNA replication protein DnaC